MNLHDLFAVALERDPGKPALSWAGADGPRGTGGEISYCTLLATARRLARQLRARGLAPGDRVALLLGNSPDFAAVYLALLALGTPAVPLNLAYKRREIAHILADAAPRLLITERSRLDAVDELAPAERASVEEVLTVEDLVDWADGPAAGEVGEGLPLVAGEDPALLLYTSGTTGASKGAVISHDNVLATVTGLLAAWGWQGSDTLLLTLPLFHTHGLVVGLTCALAAGATVRLHPRFDAATVLAELEAGAATLFFGVPTMYVRLVAELAGRGRPTTLPRVRLCCSGSAPLAPETFESFRELTGHTLLERYGMTEAGMILSNLYAGERRPGSVGTPLPGVSVRLVDGAGCDLRDLPAGEQGELLVAGGNVFAGYWNAPEKTAESFVQDAAGRRWFRTGDLARRDLQTGAWSLLGRRHELIVSGGFNVYPREIEEVLAGHPGVREVAVVGRPHPEWGEVPVAYVILAEDGAGGEKALTAWCRERLAGFKVPHAFHPVETLPRNALGKVQKHLLTGNSTPVR